MSTEHASDAGVGVGVGGAPEPSPLSSVPPTIEIRGIRRPVTVDTLRELWSFRGVLNSFAVRQVKVKYKQATVGIGWAVIQPVLSAALFALVFGQLVKVPSEGAPFLLFSLCGMVLWSFFSTGAGTAMESLVQDASLIRKVYFPREVLPLAAVMAALVDLVPALMTLVVVALLYGFEPSAPWVVIWLPVLVTIAAVVAVGLSVSCLNAYYRDVRYALPFFLQLGLFGSAVMYPLSIIPEPWRDVFAVANPVAGAIDAMRTIVINGDWPDFALLAGALAWGTFAAMGGYLLFKRLERGLADRV